MTSENPDFTKLFPLDRPEEDGEWRLTPRTASVLHTELNVLADQIYDDIEQRGDEPVTNNRSMLDGGDWYQLARFPRITWRQNAEWRRQLARAADDLANDLEAGNWPIPRCTAEEVCLHLALKDAKDTIHDGEEGDWVTSLPEHDDDYDWELAEEYLFQDTDFKLLYDPMFDGIEDPTNEIHQRGGMAEMRPKGWFGTFNNADDRDPDRGFRR